MSVRNLIKWLGLAVVIILVLLLLLSFSFSRGKFVLDDPGFKDTIRFEILKSLLQLLVVVIIGGGISALFKSSEADRERTKKISEAWADCLKRIADDYHQVKSIRRALIAAGLTEKFGKAPKTLSTAQVEVYKENMVLLNKAQLDFEALRREVKLLPDFLLLSDTHQHLDILEKYLRRILNEYEHQMTRLTGEAPVPFSELQRLREFTTSTEAKFTFKEGTEHCWRFLSHFADRYDKVLFGFNTAFKTQYPGRKKK